MNRRWKILNLADITACPDVFEPLAQIADVVSLPTDRSTLVSRIGEFDAYYASLQVRMDAEVLQHTARLRVIATPSTGLDHIDLETAKARGVEVISIKEDTEFLNNVTATAELAWALLLATVRRMPSAVNAARNGHWARDEFRGHQISGKTLGVLGYGRLGRMVAEYGKAFRMRVLACDTRAVEVADSIECVDFETLLRESDVLSIHIHLTEENRNLINARALSQMKPGAVIINTSRGAIIDETALLKALESGHLGGAGLDVIHGEWSDNLREHPLIRYMNERDNLVITPHVGGITFESQRMAYGHTAQKLKRYLEMLRKE